MEAEHTAVGKINLIVETDHFVRNHGDLSIWIVGAGNTCDQS